MAKVTITGNSFTVFSSVKLDDIKMVAKYRPELLKLKSEDGKVTEYQVCVSSHGDIGNVGAEFSSKNADGYAYITVAKSFDGVASPIDKVTEDYSKAILCLEKIEVQILEALEDIAVEHASVREKITVAE